MARRSLLARRAAVTFGVMRGARSGDLAKAVDGRFRSRRSAAGVLVPSSSSIILRMMGVIPLLRIASRSAKLGGGLSILSPRNCPHAIAKERGTEGGSTVLSGTTSQTSRIVLWRAWRSATAFRSTRARAPLASGGGGSAILVFPLAVEATIRAGEDSAKAATRSSRSVDMDGLFCSPRTRARRAEPRNQRASVQEQHCRCRAPIHPALSSRPFVDNAIRHHAPNRRCLCCLSHCMPGQSTRCDECRRMRPGFSPVRRTPHKPGRLCHSIGNQRLPKNVNLPSFKKFIGLRSSSLAFAMAVDAELLVVGQISDPSALWQRLDGARAIQCDEQNGIRANTVSSCRAIQLQHADALANAATSPRTLAHST